MESSFFRYSLLCLLTPFVLTPFSAYSQDRGEIIPGPSQTNMHADRNLKTNMQENEEQSLRSNRAEPSPVKRDLIVRNITFKTEPGSFERVLVELSRPASPALSSIEGKTPRVIADFKNVAAVKKGLTTIEVEGKMIRRIRTWLDKSTHNFRVVLDLEPGVDYFVNQTYIKAENLYVLDVQEN
jgi:hypothetical protein